MTLMAAWRAGRRYRIRSAPATRSIRSIRFLRRTCCIRMRRTRFAATGYITSVVHTKSQSVGLYFVDTVHLGKLFEVSGGVRWDYFDTVYNSYQPVAPPAGRNGERADRADQQAGQAAELSRGVCVQADEAWQRVLRLWDELQSGGGVAELERADGEQLAGCRRRMRPTRWARSTA